jgi:hypothetical protein
LRQILQTQTQQITPLGKSEPSPSKTLKGITEESRRQGGSMGVFRDTTQVAIREMIEEFGAASRFGRVYSTTDLEEAAGRLAEFFEMTLSLRATYGAGGGATHSPQNQTESVPKGNKRSAEASASFGAKPNRLGLNSGYVEESREDLNQKTTWLSRSRSAPEISKTTLEMTSPAQFVEKSSTKENDARLFQLPRKKVTFTEAERERFSGLRREG